VGQAILHHFSTGEATVYSTSSVLGQAILHHFSTGEATIYSTSSVLGQSILHHFSTGRLQYTPLLLYWGRLYSTTLVLGRLYSAPSVLGQAVLHHFYTSEAILHPFCTEEAELLLSVPKQSLPHLSKFLSCRTKGSQEDRLQDGL
jgi:hypothetical protein